jgi:hypothetical protein
MSQQERRLKDGMRADGVEPKSDATKDLIEYGQILLNGIGALQSADYVGDPDSQRAVNDQHDRLQDKLDTVVKKLEARGIDTRSIWF